MPFTGVWVDGQSVLPQRSATWSDAQSQYSGRSKGVLISRASGNFSDPETWGLVDPTSFLDSEANIVYIPIAPLWATSAAFIPGAITIDGIAVKIYNRQTPVGNWTVELYNTTDGISVAGTTVTVAVADILVSSSVNINGWYLFRFSAVTLTAGKSYAVRANQSSSTANRVGLYRNATTDNISRMLRTTTQATPVVGDVMHVIGELTGIGAGNDFVVDMDSETNTDFGTGVDGVAALTVGKRGTLSYKYASGHNYYLKLSGDMIVYYDGTFNIGTIANPIPRDSTAVLEFDPVADGGMGLIVYGTCNMQGLSRSAGKNIVSCKLSGDVAANGTSLTVDTDTGWLDNDQIAVATTTRTAAECEAGTLNGNAGSGSMAVDGFLGTGGGVKYAHSGTSPTQGEIINLTRNVKVRAVSSTLRTYVYAQALSTVDFDWAEFYYIGYNAGGKNGIVIATTTGSFSIMYCSIHDFAVSGVATSGAPGNNNFVISYCVFWNGAASYAVYTSATTGTNWTISYCIVMLCTSAGFYLNDLGGVFAYNTSIGCGTYNFSLAENTTNGVVVESCVAHGGASYLFNLGGCYGATFNNITLWRGNDTAFNTNGRLENITWNNLLIFGTNCGTYFNSSVITMEFYNCVFAADTTFSCAYFFLGAGGGGVLRFYNCTFGKAQGIFAGFSSGDFSIGTGSSAKIYMYNCLLASTTEVAGVAAFYKQGAIYSSKHDQTNGLHKTWKYGGLIERDSLVYKTAAPAQKMTPSSASIKLESASKLAPVDINGTVTFSVWVRKSKASTGDSADYNGNQPRLILKRNDPLGTSADTVLATMTAAIGNWELLTGTTPVATDTGVWEIVVDCDGTTGFISCDDWSAV